MPSSVLIAYCDGQNGFVLFLALSRKTKV